MFSAFWEVGEVPQGDKDAPIVHLYKRKGDRKKCDHFAQAPTYMAATIYKALRFCLFFIIYLYFICGNNSLKIRLVNLQKQGRVCEMLFVQYTQIWSYTASRERIRRSILKWNVGGLTFLAAPKHSVLLDITISMDVSPNPGPDFTWMETESRQACQTNSQSFQQYASQQYYGLSEGRNRLLYLRKFCWKPSTCVMAKLKSMGILKYRSRRRGKNITFPKPT